MFTFDQAQAAGPVLLPGLQVSRMESGTGAAQFDLTLGVSDGPAGLTMSFGYARNIFDAATVERLAEHYVSVLQRLDTAGAGDLRLGEIGPGGADAAVPLAAYASAPLWRGSPNRRHWDRTGRRCRARVHG
jgi:non-ribosomal peptide synthetase component F